MSNHPWQVMQDAWEHTEPRSCRLHSRYHQADYIASRLHSGLSRYWEIKITLTPDLGKPGITFYQQKTATITSWLKSLSCVEIWGAKRGCSCEDSQNTGAGRWQVLHDHVRQGGVPEQEQWDELGHPAAAQGGQEGAAGGVRQGVHLEVGVTDPRLLGNFWMYFRAHISQPDGTFGMKVKRCFSFSDQNSTVELVDERGCPEPSIMSEFRWVIMQQDWFNKSCLIAYLVMSFSKVSHVC